MAKPLSNREMELFNIALNYAVDLDKCNPEASMESNRFMWAICNRRRRLAQKIAEQLSFQVLEDDLHELCENISGS